MTTKISKNVANADLHTPDVMSQAEANAGTSTVERVITAEVIRNAYAFYYSQLGPPQDYLSLWDLSTYTTPAANSYLLPRSQIVDDGPDNVTLTVTNPASDGIDADRTVRIQHSMSVPDGLGLYFSEDFYRQASHEPEHVRLDSLQYIDFTATGAYSFGMWINPSFISAGVGMTKRTCLIAQSNGANELRVYVEVDHVAGGNNVARIVFDSKFVGVGSPTSLSYQLTGDAKGWRRLRVQQNTTTMEIMVDGASVASVSPVGAIGIDIANSGGTFRIGGDMDNTGTTNDYMGGIGQTVDRYGRMLTPSEETLWYDDASNFDNVTGKTLSDIGSVFNKISTGPTNLATTPDRKTVSFSASSAANMLSFTGTIYAYSPKVEFQIRGSGAVGAWSVGFSAETTTNNTSWVGSRNDYGLRWNFGEIFNNGSAVSASQPAIDPNAVITIRIDPAGNTQEWLINNVAYYSAALGINFDTALRGIRPAIGNAQSTFNTPSGSLEILSKEADFVYPIGSGYTDLDSI